VAAAQVPRADKLLATVAAATRNGLGSDGWLTEPSGNVYMHRCVRGRSCNFFMLVCPWPGGVATLGVRRHMHMGVRGAVCHCCCQGACEYCAVHT